MCRDHPRLGVLAASLASPHLLFHVHTPYSYLNAQAKQEKQISVLREASMELLPSDSEIPQDLFTS